MTGERASAHTVPFFVGAFSITWGLQLPAVITRIDALMPLAVLGIFGPAIAATWLARREPGGVRALYAGLRAWRVSPVWYLVALALPGALLVAGMAVASGFGDRDLAWVYPPRGGRIAAMVLVAFGEEIGWRGFALPRLEARYGALRASMVIGVLWAFWHVPMVVGQGIALMPLMIVMLVPGSIVFTWIWKRTGKSLLLAVLTHMGVHLNNSLAALPGTTTPFVVHTIAYVIAAAVIVLADRKVFAVR
jgi:uncharacterized protein